MSGAAGLIYEVAWTRLLALRLGHTTAAASAVVAAFMGGLALGAAVAGPRAASASLRRALHLYAAVELLVVVVALTLPFQLDATVPLLRAAYADGSSNWWFPLVRGTTAIAVLLIPATALGASFPLAIRAYASWGGAPGALYAVNTLGAAVGATAAGFALIPALGLWRTTLAAVFLSATAMCLALALARAASGIADFRIQVADCSSKSPAQSRRSPLRRRGRTVSVEPDLQASQIPPWITVLLAAITGYAGFVLEIAWTRVFALVAGPSAYAFAATLTCFITGLAIGALSGEWIRVRVRGTATALAVGLGGAALVSALATSIAGTSLPQRIAGDLAASTDTYLELLARHAVWTGALILPTAALLGLAFTVLLGPATAGREPSRTASLIFAVNTAAGVVGALTAGFLWLPRLGLKGTLSLATALLAVAAAAACLSALRRNLRVALLCLPVAACALLVAAGPWNGMLLASGAYKYARYLPRSGDLEAMLTAGDLRYYRDGASATVAVRELAGVRTLAIDGKVDASSGGDMTTQKVLAHLPLLLHPNPKRVLVVGLGSGVTAGAALAHPIGGLDIVEISPEVVDASDHFVDENRRALFDRRTRLIVGDGRSHLLLANARYDVIVSEPSNPWMAGVAALFTQEFFAAARARLAPGGVLCQWAHTYDISTSDLRSIAATFASVFPHGTMWLLGEGDLLLVGSDEPLDGRLTAIEANWTRPGVAEDLSAAHVHDPFSLISTYAGGPAQLADFARDAAIQRDDRMALEYTGPRALNGSSSAENAHLLAAVQEQARASSNVARWVRQATAEQWRRRGRMMLASDAVSAAYADFDRALAIDPSDLAAAEGLVRASVAQGSETAAMARLTDLAQANMLTPAPLVALSKLQAGVGQFEDAARTAIRASQLPPPTSAAFEQLASVYADAGDVDGLAAVVEAMRALFPEQRPTAYYAAALSFLQGDLASARRLAEHASAVDQAYAPAHNLRGAVYASSGDVARAREAFRVALALDPRDTSIYANLGRLEAEPGGDVRTAARLFAEALTLDPHLEPAREGLEAIRRRRH